MERGGLVGGLRRVLDKIGKGEVILTLPADRH